MIVFGWGNLIAQNCPANINDSPGNAPQTITATVFDNNGQPLFDITCESTGNSQQIDCNLEDFDLDDASFISIEFGGGNNTTECVYDVFGNNIGVLPVEFGDLTVSRSFGENTLKWNTFSEVDNDYFTIKYSFDGSNWSELETVNGAGNTSTEKEYSYVHRISGFKTMYYRLKQTDYDGTTVELKTVAIQNTDADEDISIETGNGSVKIFSENDIDKIIVSDLQGRRVNYDIIAENKNFAKISLAEQKSIKILTVVDINGNAKNLKLR